MMPFASIKTKARSLTANRTPVRGYRVGEIVVGPLYC